MFSSIIRQNNILSGFLSIVLVCAILGGYSNADAQNNSRLAVSIRDNSTDSLTPVRISLTDSKGNHTKLPQEAIGVMYGRYDGAEGYGFQPDSAFYADGYFSIDLKPDTYELDITKGTEYLAQHHSLNLRNGDLDTTIVIKRWINMPNRGWYSSDDHIHMRRSPRENPPLLRWIAAEDIHVGVLLQMGDYHTGSYYAQYAFGKKGQYHEHEKKGVSRNILSSGQEDPRTHEIGHTISLGADSLVRFKDHYYYYDRVADKVHELNGLFGYAHEGVTFHAYRGMVLDVLDNKVDFLEILQTCIDPSTGSYNGGPLDTNYYYLFLNLGYQLTATAGSDFPWCGYSRYTEKEGEWNARIGNVRFYTYVGKNYSFKKWKKGFEIGHTFVSNGPMIFLKVNNQLPGSVIDIKKGDKVNISVTAYGQKQQVPLESLQLVSQGKVLDSNTNVIQSESKQRLILKKTINAEKGMWIAARVKAGPLQYAHTTPVYIQVNGDGFYDSKNLPKNVDEAESYLDELSFVLYNQDSTVADNQAWHYKNGLLERIKKTRKKLEKMRELAE